MNFTRSVGKDTETQGAFGWMGSRGSRHSLKELSDKKERERRAAWRGAEGLLLSVEGKEQEPRKEAEDRS